LGSTLFFGGALATHIRAESPLFTHTLFPIYIAALLWAGLKSLNPYINLNGSAILAGPRQTGQRRSKR
jgi:hypothetical protein